MIATQETTNYPPEYLNEDIGPSLFATCIVFLFLETVFMILMYASRYVSKGERTNKSMEVLLTLTYLICIGKITIMICE
jgi:ABC-type Na+ efflux pump permease subunit